MDPQLLVCERGDGEFESNSNCSNETERGDKRDEITWTVYVWCVSRQWKNSDIVRAKSRIIPKMNSCLALPSAWLQAMQSLQCFGTAKKAEFESQTV